MLATAQHWSKQMGFADTTEINSFVRSLISRISVHRAKIEVHIPNQALRAVLIGKGRLDKSPKVNHSDGRLRLEINAVLKRCGGKVRLVLPADSSGEGPAHRRPSQVKAVVRAHDWHQRILRGELTGAESIARVTGLDERYVSRVLQRAFLAPDIVKIILEGQQPAQMTFDRFRHAVPVEWRAQRKALGFPRKESVFRGVPRIQKRPSFLR